MIVEGSQSSYPEINETQNSSVTDNSKFYKLEQFRISCVIVMQDFLNWSNKRKEKIIRYISKYINVFKFLGITLVFFQLLV